MSEFSFSGLSMFYHLIRWKVQEFHPLLFPLPHYKDQLFNQDNNFKTFTSRHHATRRVTSFIFTMEDSGKTFSSEEEAANYWKDLAMTYKQRSVL